MGKKRQDNLSSNVFIITGDLVNPRMLVASTEINKMTNHRCWRCNIAVPISSDSRLPMIRWIDLLRYQAFLKESKFMRCVRKFIDASPMIHFECFEDLEQLIQTVLKMCPEEKEEREEKDEKEEKEKEKEKYERNKREDDKGLIWTEIIKHRNDIFKPYYDEALKICNCHICNL